MDSVVNVSMSESTMKAIKSRYATKDVQEDPDVMIYATKELLTESDKAIGMKNFCHSWILVAHSPTLKNIMSEASKKNGNSKRNVTKIYMKEVHQNMMITVLRYMYRGECIFRREDADEIIHTAAFLQMEHFECECLAEFSKGINSESVLDHLNVFALPRYSESKGDHLDLRKAWQKLEGLCMAPLKQLIKSEAISGERKFKIMSEDVLHALLELCYLAGLQEEELQIVVDSWSCEQAYLQARKQYALPKDYDFVDGPDSPEYDEIADMVKEVGNKHQENVASFLALLYQCEKLE